MSDVAFAFIAFLSLLLSLPLADKDWIHQRDDVDCRNGSDVGPTHLTEVYILEPTEIHVDVSQPLRGILTPKVIPEKLPLICLLGLATNATEGRIPQ